MSLLIHAKCHNKQRSKLSGIHIHIVFCLIYFTIAEFIYFQSTIHWCEYIRVLYRRKIGNVFRPMVLGRSSIENRLGRNLEIIKDKNPLPWVAKRLTTWIPKINDWRADSNRSHLFWFFGSCKYKGSTLEHFSTRRRIALTIFPVGLLRSLEVAQSVVTGISWHSLIAWAFSMLYQKS